MSLRADSASQSTYGTGCESEPFGRPADRRPVTLDEATRESIVQLIRADLRRARASEAYARTFAMRAQVEALRARQATLRQLLERLGEDLAP